MRHRHGLLRGAVAIAALVTAGNTAAQAMKLKPFDTPPPAIDAAKIATMKPGTHIAINYDEVLLVGTKGYVILKTGPKTPIPADVQPAAPGIELRLRGYGVFKDLKRVEFMTRLSGEQRIVTAYLAVYADKGRVAACGYFVRTDNKPFAADFFTDLRSYVDVGGAFRLPAAFIQDETVAAQRPDGKIPARCVDTNIEWDPAYRAMPISLHLVATPYAYEWKLLASSRTSPPAPPSPPQGPTAQSPYD